MLFGQQLVLCVQTKRRPGFAFCLVYLCIYACFLRTFKVITWCLILVPNNIITISLRGRPHGCITWSWCDRGGGWRWGEMEAGDPLCQPLKGETKRTRRLKLKKNTF